MAPPDATPQNLFPAATTPERSASPGAGGYFGTPSTGEFPLFAGPEDAAMTAFGGWVEADKDLDHLDARVSHVRDARYGPGSQAPDVSRVVSMIAPVTAPMTAPVTHSREHAWRTRVLVFLAVFAVSVLAGFGGVFFLTR
jgi:hypothetical protein